MAEDKTLEDYINENKKNNNLAQYYSYYSFNNYQNGFKNTFGFGRNDLEFYLGNYTETINLINYKLNEELNSDGLTLFQILGIDVDTLETNVITLYAYFGILIDLIDNDAPGMFQGVYSNTIGSLLDSDALENEVYIINLERYIGIQENKLKNKSFSKNAPPDVILKEEEKLKQAKVELEKLTS